MNSKGLLFALLGLALSELCFASGIRWRSGDAHYDSGARIGAYQEIFFSQDRLGSDAPGHTKSADGLEYVGGPGEFTLSYGPYHGGVYGVRVEAFLVFERLNITPHTYETSYKTCRKRNWKQGCVSWNHHVTTHTREHGYILDLATSNEDGHYGARVLASQRLTNFFTQNTYTDIDRNIYPKSITLSYDLQPDEVLDDLEIRMIAPFGADFDVKIKYAVFIVTLY